MNNIQKLYIVAGFQALVVILPNDLIATSSLVVKLILQITTMVLAYRFILADTKLRKLSESHALWALLSPFGIVIYHLFFVLRYKVKIKRQ